MVGQAVHETTGDTTIMTAASSDDEPRTRLQAAGEALVEKILSSGVDGVGRLKGSKQLADEALLASRDVEQAIDRLVATQRRIVGASGFATGLGGFAVMAVAVPADVVSLYTISARLVGAIAHLRGYDVYSEEVRSLILVSLLGASGASVLSDVGVQIGNKTALAALKRLPGRVLIQINKTVGFRLVTKFGQKGVINLVKIVPLAGGAAGTMINLAAINGIATYAKRHFPAVQD